MGQENKRLKVRMFERDMSQNYLAIALNRTARYVSVRMNSRLPWDLWDVYKICDLLEIPYTEICDYFPPIGNNGKRGGGKCMKLQ